MDLLNRYPKVTATLALLAVAGSIALMVNHVVTSNTRPKGDLWFYNVVTGELFPESDLSVPPIDTESGPGTGVRAFVYSCGDCADPDQRFIAYLDKLTPQAKQIVEAQIKETGAPTGIGYALDKVQAAILVRAPDGTRWYPQFSKEGLALVQAGKQRGGCGRPKPCLP